MDWVRYYTLERPNARSIAAPETREDVRRRLLMREKERGGGGGGGGEAG